MLEINISEATQLLGMTSSGVMPEVVKKRFLDWEARVFWLNQGLDGSSRWKLHLTQSPGILLKPRMVAGNLLFIWVPSSIAWDNFYVIKSIVPFPFCPHSLPFHTLLSHILSFSSIPIKNVLALIIKVILVYYRK